MSIEIRLGPREERMQDFDAGKTDVMFLSYTEERAARYQLLDQTWTLAQVVMMRPGLPRYPHGLDDLWGVRIAVDENSINHQLLAALPESRRPALTVVATREDADPRVRARRGRRRRRQSPDDAVPDGTAGRERGRSAADLAAVSPRRAAGPREHRRAAARRARSAEEQRRVRSPRRAAPEQPGPPHLARALRDHPRVRRRRSCCCCSSAARRGTARCTARCRRAPRRSSAPSGAIAISSTTRAT